MPMMVLLMRKVPPAFSPEQAKLVASDLAKVNLFR